MKLEAPPSALKDRVLAAVRAEPSLTRPKAVSRSVAVIAAATVLSMMLFELVLGGARLSSRPPAHVIASALGWMAVTILSASVVLRRGRTMLGRSRRALGLVALVLPILLYVWLVLWGLAYADVLDAPGERIGLRCLWRSLAMGALPLVAFLVARHRSDPLHPEWLGGALGAAAGAWAGFWITLWCPLGASAHLALGHLLPVLLLAAVGALAARLVLPPS